ncbi:glycosyltransferase family 2 protein [Anaerosporobacter faecicola]|uniref:glycosyltransferase family 2 protein n=1 Tax=Anaerosporobacter faecicola TaxID=2718714 RepID=UPI00143B67BF|nr:glycosyltransferase [Anaerosporobacter faecicola]
MQFKKVFAYVSYGFFQMKTAGLRMTINQGLHWIRNKQSLSYSKWIRKVESKEYSCKPKENRKQQVSTYHIIIPICANTDGSIDKNKVSLTVRSVYAQEENSAIKISLWLFDTKEEERIWCNEQFAKKRNIRIYTYESRKLSTYWTTFLTSNKEDYIAIIPVGDQLRKQAFLRIRNWLKNKPDYDMIYTDEDYRDHKGQRFAPVWKPDWSPDLLMNTPYCIHLCLYRRTILEKINWETFEGLNTWEYEIALRVTEETNRIAHVPEILYHHGKSTEMEDKQNYQSIRRKAITRRGQRGSIEEQGVYYILDSKPLVSIILLSKDNDKLLIQCLESILRLTTYPNLEIIIIDNGSGEVTRKRINTWLSSNDRRQENRRASGQKVAIHYEIHPMAFNYSSLCNLGVNKAKGVYIIFLNDDIQVITTDWIERLIGHASLSYVGAVGAKLLYPETKLIQHMGIINLAAGPAHIMQGKRKEDSVLDTRNYLAVTGACLAIARERFYEVHGFSENYACAWNDVDLCLKLYERGYYNVVRNDVELIHYEAYTRKNECLDHRKLLRLEYDKRRLYKNHPILKETDPFYNRNLNQHRTDFSLGYGGSVLNR